MKNVSYKSCRGNENTHFVVNIYFLCGKSYRLWDNVEKYCRGVQTTQGNILWCMRISCWIPKATNTHSRICNTYCFSTATLVARTRLSVTLCLYCPSCWYCRAILIPRLFTFSHVDCEIEDLQEATLPAVYCVRNVVEHGDAREGKWRGNWRVEWVASTLTRPRNVVYPALLTLMRTPRLPAVDWTDSPPI